jgi:putative hemolysin
LESTFVETVISFAIILILTIANGLFSMSETAVVSSRRARLQQRSDSGDAAAGRALRLSEQPNVFLATVQIGITLIGTLSGAFGGARLSGPVADLLDGLPGIGRFADTIAFALVVLVITYLSLVIGELVPKRIALNNPESIASTVAGPMNRLSKIVAPVVHLLGVSTNAVLTLLRVRDSDQPPVTEEEVGVLLEQGARAGIFLPAEREMTERVFDLADDRVAALMTPRPEVTWINTESSPEEIATLVLESPFSRFPVARDSLDNLIGVISAKELLGHIGNGTVGLPDSFRQPLIFPESMMALRALERFRQTGEHLAIVIDEYGGTAGILSITDILEALVGDMPAPGETRTRDAYRRPDGSWLLEGSMPADDMAERLGIRDLPGEAEGLYETAGGFVLAQLGHIPELGDQFSIPGWTFEIVDMDGLRVDKLLATPNDEPAIRPNRSARQD